MATYETLRQAINSLIKTNGNEEITGAILNQVLNAMITALGANYQFCGEATPSTNPGQPMQNVFYFAYDAGTYVNFGNITLPMGISTLSWDGTQWTGETIYQIDSTPVLNSTRLITSGGVYNALAAITQGTHSGFLYAGIAEPTDSPSALVNGQRIFYLATQAGTYTNFLVNYDIPMVIPNNGIWVLTSGADDDDWTAQEIVGIDDKPTSGSNNLVKSGGVFNELALGAVYDVSAKNPTAGPNNDGKWESLSALLSDANLNTLIPTSVRRGGMSIKFVHTSDNKYVQFRYMGTSTANVDFTNVANWQGVIDIPIDGDNNVISSDGVAKTVLPLWPIIEKLDATVLKSSTEVISSKYIDSNGNLQNSVLFSTVVYNLSNISPVIKIHATTRWTIPYYAFYSSDVIDSEHCIGISEIHSGDEPASKDFIVAVPKNATHLVILGYNYPIAWTILYSYDIDSIPPFLKLVSQTLTITQKKQVLTNIGISENDFIVLSYWGQSASDIQALSQGEYFYNTYNNLPYKKTGAIGTSTVEALEKKQCQLFYNITNSHFYCYLDGETFTDISGLMAQTFIQNTTGQSTTKTMSQKVITDNFNSINASVSRIVFGNNAEEGLNYSQHIGNKALTSDGNLADITGIGTNVYIYSVQNLKTKLLKIIASTRYSRPYYAFYSSDSISSSTLIEKSEEHSGSASTSKTFTDVVIPAGATHLVINYILDSNQYTYGVFNLCPFILNNTYSSLYNKKWACIGDSLTAINNKTTRHYFDFVAEETGIIPLNYGYSGSGYARLREENHAFYQRIGAIDQASDVITLFGSFNDLGALSDDFHLGDVDDTGTTSLAGCINTTIDNLYTIIPTARLGIVAPTPWATSQPGSNNSAKLYVDLLEAISVRRSIPFLDLWRHSNLRPWDSSFAQLVYSEDPVASATHPNAIGHSIIAPMFREFVKSLL